MITIYTYVYIYILYTTVQRVTIVTIISCRDSPLPNDYHDIPMMTILNPNYPSILKTVTLLQCELPRAATFAAREYEPREPATGSCRLWNCGVFVALRKMGGKPRWTCYYEKTNLLCCTIWYMIGSDSQGDLQETPDNLLFDGKHM